MARVAKRINLIFKEGIKQMPSSKISVKRGWKGDDQRIRSSKSRNLRNLRNLRDLREISEAIIF